MNIRPVHPDDVPAITAMLNAEIANGIAHFGTQPIDKSEIAEQLNAAEDKFPWYTAVDEKNEFLGFCKSAPWSPRGGYDWTVEITIYIMSNAQGQGVGKALYTKLLGTLRAQRFQVVVAGISEPNPASVALHRSIGMEQTGYNTAMGYKHGQWIDVSYYQLILGGPQTPQTPPIPPTLSNPPPPVLSIKEALSNNQS